MMSKEDVRRALGADRVESLDEAASRLARERSPLAGAVRRVLSDDMGYLYADAERWEKARR